MRRLKLGAALVALAALALTSIAVADEGRKASVTAVSAHFTTTGSVKTRTCTSGGVTFVQTQGTFSGTSTSSEPRLNGTVRITLRSFVNSATGLGIATGKFRFRSATRGKTDADLTAVVSGASRLDGFLRGNTENGGGDRRLSHNGDREAAKLFANVSATMTATTLSGDLGTGGHLNTAVIAGGGCED